MGKINDVDIFSVLFHDLFYTLIQTTISLALLVSILNLSKEKADDLYPINLDSKYYGDGSCDLGNLRPGESSFCDSYVVKENDTLKAGNSFSASTLAKFAKNNGFITSDSYNVFLLWGCYLVFNCELFAQKILNGTQYIAQSLDNIYFPIQFVIILTIMSIINNLKLNYINPFFKKLLNAFAMFNVSSKNQSNIFIDLSIQLFINIASIFVLLFLFFMIPLTIFYIFAMCKILTENLTIQMNILSIFALFLTVKSLLLFVEFMQNQIGGNGRINLKVGVTGEFNSQLFQSFISSYLLNFIIPIIIALLFSFKTIVNIVSNMNPLGLDIKYKLIIITLLLVSFYYPIKYDLDYPYKFPYSTIYAVFSGLSIAYLAYKINN